MTWDELNEKYPESRDEMSADRERDFLKDLYDVYETIGFVNKFWTLDAYPEEIYLNDMIANGYKPH